MTLTADMAAVAAECIKKPTRRSVWSAKLGRYVCSDELEHDEAIVAASATKASPPPLNPAFKLVFLTAAGGTALFVFICIAIHLVVGGEMPTPLAKLVDGLFDLAKIGFGAIAGLLGGVTLKADNAGA
jgi:hypothetical protein